MEYRVWRMVDREDGRWFHTHIRTHTAMLTRAFLPQHTHTHTYTHTHTAMLTRALLPQHLLDEVDVSALSDKGGGDKVHTVCDTEVLCVCVCVCVVCVCVCVCVWGWR
jgi:hypothetical protein